MCWVWFFPSPTLADYLNRSPGKMEWSLCRHEGTDIEFSFSSLSKLGWICYALFLAKHFSSASTSSNLPTDETCPDPSPCLKAAQNLTKTKGPAAAEVLQMKIILRGVRDGWLAKKKLLQKKIPMNLLFFFKFGLSRK